MAKIERIVRRVESQEMADWLGRLAKTGMINPYRNLYCRILTSTELAAAPELPDEDIDTLSAWLDDYRRRQPAIEHVPLISTNAVGPLLVVSFGHGDVYDREREAVLTGLGEMLWTVIATSPEVFFTCVIAPATGISREGNHKLAEAVNETMNDAPAEIALSGLQLRIRTESGLINL